MSRPEPRTGFGSPWIAVAAIPLITLIVVLVVIASSSGPRDQPLPNRTTAPAPADQR